MHIYFNKKCFTQNIISYKIINLFFIFYNAFYLLFYSFFILFQVIDLKFTDYLIVGGIVRIFKKMKYIYVKIPTQPALKAKSDSVLDMSLDLRLFTYIKPPLHLVP